MLGLALAVNEEQLIVLMMGNHLIQVAENLRMQGKKEKNPLMRTDHLWNYDLLLLFLYFSNLFVLLSLFSKGITVRLLQEADGDVVDLLLVEHGQSVRLPGALVRAASDEEGTILQQVGMVRVGVITVKMRRIYRRT